MLAALRENGITYTGFGDDYADARRDLVIEKGEEGVTVIAVCEHDHMFAHYLDCEAHTDV